VQRLYIVLLRMGAIAEHLIIMGNALPRPRAQEPSPLVRGHEYRATAKSRLDQVILFTYFLAGVSYGTPARYGEVIHPVTIGSVTLQTC
jgi:hypothetical protein